MVRRNPRALVHEFSFTDPDFDVMFSNCVSRSSGHGWSRRINSFLHRMIQPRNLLLTMVPLAMLCLSGCATQGDGPVTITKVNPYHLQDAAWVESDDEMIIHEKRRLIHGAIDSADYRERMGNYFTIFWSSQNRVPATVRLEYCQAETGPRVYSREVRVESPKKKNVTKFQITGEEYYDLGKVTQWRASVIENGAEVAEYRSFLWR